MRWLIFNASNAFSFRTFSHMYVFCISLLQVYVEVGPRFSANVDILRKKWIFSKNTHIRFPLPEVFSMLKLDFWRGGP